MLVKTEFVVNIYPKEFNDFFTLYFSIRDFKYYIFNDRLCSQGGGGGVLKFSKCIVWADFI